MPLRLQVKVYSLLDDAKGRAIRYNWRYLLSFLQYFRYAKGNSKVEQIVRQSFL